MFLWSFKIELYKFSIKSLGLPTLVVGDHIYLKSGLWILSFGSIAKASLESINFISIPFFNPYW
jgi:hypothetical protein